MYKLYLLLLILVSFNVDKSASNDDGGLLFKKVLYKVIYNTCNDSEISINNITKNLQKLEKCYTKLGNNFQEDIDFGISHGTLNQIINRYCKRVDDAFLCVNDVFDFLKMCMKNVELQSLQNFLNKIKSLKTYTCTNNGTEFTNFYKNRGIECLDDNLDKLTNCSQFSLPQFDTLNFTILEKLLYQYLRKFKDCSEPILKTCHATAYKFLIGFMEIFENDFKNNEIKKTVEKNYKIMHTFVSSGKDVKTAPMILIILTGLFVLYFNQFSYFI